MYRHPMPWISRLKLYCLVFSLLLAAPLPASAADPAFVPRDEAAGDGTWTRFRDRLVEALQQRDRKFVLGVVDRNVRNGIGRPNGIEEFSRQWHINEDDGPLWRELPRALNLAAAYYRHERMPRSLCAPYVLPQWPKSIDPFGHGAITARQSDVRAAPSGAAAIHGSIGHAIVRVADWEVADTDPENRQKWVKIQAQNREGFVPEEHVRSPLEHLACFRKDESGWRLISFLAAGE